MKIADLFVDLNLDTKGFNNKLRAALAAASSQDVSVKVDADTKLAEAKIKKLGKIRDGGTFKIKADTVQLGRAGKQIDTLSGRLKLLIQTGASVGPALIPLAAGTIPAITGLTTQFTAAAGAAGVAVLAFDGVGDALKALTSYNLDPSVANLEKMNETMGKLGPTGREFVRTLSSMKPALDALKSTAQDNLFPGLTDGLHELRDLGPTVTSIVAKLGAGLGQLAREAGQGAVTGGVREFLEYINKNGQQYLLDFGRTIGNFAAGIGHLITAMDPLSRSFSSGFLDMSRSFNQWATQVTKTQGFRDFLDYVRTSGPQALQAIGAISKALLAIVQAAAPIGQVLLPAITGLANAFAALAGTKVGRTIILVASAVSALNLALKASSFAFRTAGSAAAMFGIQSKSAAVGAAATTKSMKALNVAALALAGVAVADILQTQPRIKPSTPIDETTASLAKLQSVAEKDTLPKQFKNLEDAVHRLAHANPAQKLQDKLADTFGFGGGSELANARTQIKDIDEALVGIGQNEGPDAAKKALQGLYDSGVLTKGQFKDIKTLLPGYSSMMSAAATNTDVFSTSTKKAAMSQQELYTAINNTANAATTGFGAWTTYNQAVADAQKQAKSGAKGIDVATEAGRKNRASLEGQAAAWNNLGEKAQNIPGRYAKAKKSFIDTAVAMGVPEKRAERLAARLLEVGNLRVKPRVDEQGAKDSTQRIKDFQAQIKTLKDKRVNMSEAGAKAATERIKRLREQIQLLRDRTVYINYIRRNPIAAAGAAKTAHENAVAPAGGGLIFGPGTSTSDSIPARLSTGEYVVRAAAVQRYGADFLHGINQMRFARGGEVRGDRRQRRAIFGAATIKDYANGIAKGFNASQVARTLERLIRRNLSGQREKAQLAKLDRLDTKLANVVAANNRVAAALSRRDALIEERRTFAENIKTAITPEISAFGQATGGIRGGLAEQRSRATTLVARLNSLKKAGFPNLLISQIAGLGLFEGVAAADQLLALSVADQKAVTADFTYLNTFAQQQSTGLSNAFYSASIAGANAYLKQMQTQQARYNKIFENAAEAFARQLSTVLGVSTGRRGRGRPRRRRRRDSGGWLDPGETVVENGTGSREAVLTSRQWNQMERLIGVLERNGGGTGGPLIAHADIHSELDLDRYERQRAFRNRSTRIGG